MDENKVREMLVAFLTDVADRAMADAKSGQSNIGSIFDSSLSTMKMLDEQKIREIITDIKKATMTKESAARLMNAILLAAKTIAITMK